MNALKWPDGSPKSQNNAFDWHGTSEFMRQFMKDTQRSEKTGSAGRAAASAHPQVTVYSPARIAADLIASAKAGV